MQFSTLVIHALSLAAFAKADTWKGTCLQTEVDVCMDKVVSFYLPRDVRWLTTGFSMVNRIASTAGANLPAPVTTGNAGTVVRHRRPEGPKIIGAEQQEVFLAFTGGGSSLWGGTRYFLSSLGGFKLHQKQAMKSWTMTRKGTA